VIYLLDTHTLIWSILETQKLSRTARGILIDRNNEICVSVVSFWEISIKTRLGKFLFNININDFPRYAREMGFRIIDLKEQEAITFHELPLNERHKDPFDRMLIWQSIVNDMVLISRDGAMDDYKKDGLKIAW
jgi:PIN domain nuclease of toxin-antitoxin system